MCQVNVNVHLEVLLPEPEAHLTAAGSLGRLLDVTSSSRGTAEINTDRRPHVALEAVEISPVLDTLAHALEDAAKVGTTKVCPRLELSQGINRAADRVEHNVLGGVHVELLGEIGVDLEELDAAGTGDAGGLGGLLLEGEEEGLEPLEGAGVLADPDELDTAETGGGVGAVAQVPDVLEDGGPGGDTDTGTDQNGDFVLEDVLGGGTVGAVDAESGHLLAVGKSDVVHSQGVDTLIQLGVDAASADSVAELASEVTNLSDVNRDIGVVWAGGDGKRMPLILGDGRNLEEEPLASLVLEGRLVELNLHDVLTIVSQILNIRTELLLTIRMFDNTGNLGLTDGTNLTVQPLNEVEATGPELPSPAKITNAVLPVLITGKWRNGVGCVTDEAPDGVGVQTEEKWDEQMVSVPEGLERLLSDAVMGGCVHQEHAEKHNVASGTTGLNVVNLHSGYRTNLGLLDIVEAVHCQLKTLLFAIYDRLT